MTPTDKQVTRVTVGTYPSRVGLTGTGYGKHRAIVVTILPGDTLLLRWKGTQQREYISIKEVMAYATRTRAFVERTAKRAAKKRKA